MRPTEVSLNKNQQKSILSIFSGKSKVFEKTQDAKRIAHIVGVKRNDVMLFLEESGLKNYSEGSYC